MLRTFTLLFILPVRAVELLQNSTQTEELSFALRGYARTLW